MYCLSRPLVAEDDTFASRKYQHQHRPACLQDLDCSMDDNFPCIGNEDEWLWVKEVYNQTFHPEAQEPNNTQGIPEIRVNFEFLNPSIHNVDHNDNIDYHSDHEIKKSRSKYPCVDFPSYKVRSWAKGFFVALRHNLSTKHGVWRARSNMETSFYAYEEHASQCDSCCDPLLTIRQGGRLCNHGLFLAERVIRAVDEWARLCTPKTKGKWACAFVDVPTSYLCVKRLLKAVDRGEMTEMLKNRRMQSNIFPPTLNMGLLPGCQSGTTGRKIRGPPNSTTLSVPDVSYDPEISNIPTSWGRSRIRQIVGQEARVIQSLDYYSRAIFNKLRYQADNGHGSQRFCEFVRDLGNPTEIIFSALEVLIDAISDGNRLPTSIRKVYYLLHLAVSMQQSAFISRRAKNDYLEELKTEFPAWRESLQLHDDKVLFDEIFEALWEQKLSHASPPLTGESLSTKKVMATINTFLAANRNVAFNFMDFLGERDDDYYSDEQKWEMSHMRELSQRVALQSHYNFVQQVENLVINRLLFDDTRPFHWFVKQVRDQLNSGWIGTVRELETMLVSFARIPDCTVEEYLWFCAAVFRLCTLVSHKVEPYRCYIQSPSLSYSENYLDKRTAEEKQWFPEEPTNLKDEDTEMYMDHTAEYNTQDTLAVSVSIHDEPIFAADISPHQLQVDPIYPYNYNRIRSYSDINPRSAPRFSIDVEDVDSQDFSPSEGSYVGGSIMNQLIPIMTDYDFESGSATSPTRRSPWTSPSPRAAHNHSPIPPELTDAFATASLSPTRTSSYAYESLRTPTLDSPAFLDPWANLNSPVVGMSIGGYLPTSLSTQIPNVGITSNITGSPYLESPFSIAPDVSLLATSPVMPTPTSATSISPSTQLPTGLGLQQPVRKRRRQRSDPTPKSQPKEEEPVNKKSKTDPASNSRRKSSVAGEDGSRNRRPSQKTYDCEMCGARINGPKMNFDRHVISIHGPNRRIKCPWPGCDVSMKAARSDNMRTHMKRHEQREKGGLAGTTAPAPATAKK